MSVPIAIVVPSARLPLTRSLKASELLDDYVLIVRCTMSKEMLVSHCRYFHLQVVNFLFEETWALHLKS